MLYERVDQWIVTAFVFKGVNRKRSMWRPVRKCICGNIAIVNADENIGFGVPKRCFHLSAIHSSLLSIHRDIYMACFP